MRILGTPQHHFVPSIAFWWMFILLRMSRDWPMFNGKHLSSPKIFKNITYYNLGIFNRTAELEGFHGAFCSVISPSLAVAMMRRKFSTIDRHLNIGRYHASMS